MTRLLFTILFLTALASVGVAIWASQNRVQSPQPLGVSGNDSVGVRIVESSPQASLGVSWVPVGDTLQEKVSNPQ